MAAYKGSAKESLLDLDPAAPTAGGLTWLLTA
jgi:hypothetical protein